MEKITIIYSVLGVVGVLLVIGVMFILAFVFLGKKKGKHGFILFNRGNPEQTKKYYAKVITDKKNSNNQQFHIKELNVTLEMRPPNHYEDGVGFRKITHDQKNDIIYLDGETTINDKMDLEYGLTKEEKQLALHRYDGYDRRYANPAEKTQLLTMLALFGLCFVVVIGLIGQAMIQANGVSNVVDLAKEVKEISKNNVEASKLSSKVVEQLVVVTAQLYNVQNITRTIGS